MEASTDCLGFAGLRVDEGLKSIFVRDPGSLLPTFLPCSTWSEKKSAGSQEVEVSVDCLDILTRVLVASPGDRMSMDEIKTHAWFLKGLPPGALEMNDFLLQGLANQEEVSQPCY